MKVYLKAKLFLSADSSTVDVSFPLLNSSAIYSCAVKPSNVYYPIECDLTLEQEGFIEAELEKSGLLTIETDVGIVRVSVSTNLIEHTLPLTHIIEVNPPQKSPSLEKQIGGDHYKRFAIQPIEFCMMNKLNQCEAEAIKYICRHRFKGGVQDIEKAIHYLELLKKFEYES